MKFYNLILILSVLYITNLFSAALDIPTKQIPESAKLSNLVKKVSSSERDFKYFMKKAVEYKKIFIKNILDQIPDEDINSEDFKRTKEDLELALSNMDLVEVTEAIYGCSTSRDLDCLRNAVYTTLMKSLEVSNQYFLNYAPSSRTFKKLIRKNNPRF